MKGTLLCDALLVDSTFSKPNNKGMLNQKNIMGMCITIMTHYWKAP